MFHVDACLWILFRGNNSVNELHVSWQAKLYLQRIPTRRRRKRRQRKRKKKTIICMKIIRSSLNCEGLIVLITVVEVTVLLSAVKFWNKVVYFIVLTINLTFNISTRPTQLVTALEKWKIACVILLFASLLVNITLDNRFYKNECHLNH